MKILVPVDGSKHAQEALDIARDYAKLKNADIYIVTVVPIIESIGLEVFPSEQEKIKASMRSHAETIVNQACGFLSVDYRRSHCKTIVASHSVPDAIVDYAAKEKIDVIVIGSRGLGKSSRFKMGSVASKVVKHSPCSVYVVKMPE